MWLCRFADVTGRIRVGASLERERLHDLTAVGVLSLTELLESPDRLESIAASLTSRCPPVDLSGVGLMAPVERQEVWAAGVTYLRSRTARMEESSFSASAYDRVYEAERPELFFKALADKVVGPDEPVGIRRDAKWNVPEPELALVMNSCGTIVGFAVGNDMSSRDIEGENLLYLPQAKVYERSCAIGPFIRVLASEEEARSWVIQIAIERNRETVFAGETNVAQIKRSFTELRDFLFRCQRFPHGAVLLTGTGVVPPAEFTLREDDVVRIQISGIGVLESRVVVV